MTSKYGFVYRRLATIIPTAFISVTLIFFLLEIVPGDAADVLFGPGANQQDVQALRERLGLNLPAHVRYYNFVSRLLRGDLSSSLTTTQSVNKLILEAYPTTLTIALSAMVLALLIGIPSGILAAVRRNTKVDLGVSVGALLGVSMPSFWLGLLMILAFSVYLRILPASGFVNPILDPVEGIRHLTMPAIMLGVILAGFISRMTRSSLAEVILQDYIVTARAKGVAERLVIYRHALKNALIPVVTVAGFQFGSLLGGSIIAESLFGIAGMGNMIFLGVIGRDLPVVEGVAIVMILTFILVNVVVDVIYMYLDPRVRYD